MKTYAVHTYGYTHPPCFQTLKEARERLMELVSESLAQAKRKSPTATKHKNGDDSYSITLAPDSRSLLWAAHWISEA